MDGDQGGPLIRAEALTLRLLTGRPAEMAGLQCVFEAAPDYFALVNGAPPGRAEAQSTFTALPPNKTYEDKFVWGLYAGEAMIGCADVIRGYPVREKAVIGLLLLAQPWQRRGLGRAFAQLVEQAIGVWPEIERLRIGVVAVNEGALAFWRKLGYRETGEIKANPEFVREVVVLEKPLAR
ncbi:MAG TPA: GNAT family N-acetyltransferase [Casimicrobiaceae bacterium]|jgi:RimJ/RimL family protein N-acetyltransferase|nr:GNAT family N-acetyltransferase [Casimicrobiaceae bacterium]